MRRKKFSSSTEKLFFFPPKLRKLCPICILAKVNRLNVFLKDKFYRKLLRTDQQHKKFSVLVLPFIIKTTRKDSYYKLTHQPFLPCRDAGASKNVNVKGQVPSHEKQCSPRYSEHEYLNVCIHVN